jgi:glycosyltransferase involved in cell wall biosynthesis
MDLASGPRFSLVITSYNQKKFITDAIASALSLRPPADEIIVVDDASTDGSQDILREYANRVEFITLRANRRRGGARNCGAMRATGDYLIFLDGDDALLPWAIGLYKRIADVKRPPLILGKMIYFRGGLPAVDEPLDRLQLIEYPDYLSKDRPFGVSASSLIIDRAAFESVGGWSEDRAFDVMQDQDLVLRLGTAGQVVRIISPSTVLHRVHVGQIVNDVPPYLKTVDAMILRERSGFYPGGHERRFDRAAFFGGLVLHWTRRAFRQRLFASGLSLLIRHFPSFCAAAFKRSMAFALGRQPEHTIKL